MIHSKIPLVLFCTFLSSSAFAAESDGAASTGLGGAGVANPLGTDAIRRCPAAMVLVEEYGFDVDFGLTGPVADGWRLHGAVRDTQTSFLGAGVSYTRDRLYPELNTDDLPGWTLPDEVITNHQVQETFRLGTGYALVDRAGGVGVGVSWDRTRTELADPINEFELDASVAGRVLPNVSLSATGHDLLAGGRGPSVEAGSWIRAGEWIGIAVDAVWAGETVFGGRLGTQIGLGEMFALRAGGEWIGEEEQGVAGGIGLLGVKTALDYGLRYDLQTEEFSHILGLAAVF